MNGSKISTPKISENIPYSMPQLGRCLAILLLLAVPPVLAADRIVDQKDVVSRYAAAMAAYERGDWTTAAATLDDLLTQSSNSPNRDLIQFRLAACRYLQGNLTDAEELARSVRVDHPFSPLVPGALLLEGDCAYQARSINRSLQRYWEAATHPAADRTTIDRAIASLAALLDSNVVPLWPAIASDSIPPGIACKLSHALAGRLQEQGLGMQADLLRSRCPEATDAAGVSARAERRFAVLFPLSGHLQPFGEELIRGLSVGLSFLSADSLALSVDLFDTEGDPIKAGENFLRLDHRRYDGIIGPLTSDEASVVAAAAHNVQLPIIIPAAVEGEFGLLSPYSLQLSPSLNQQVHALASYALLQRKQRSAVILTADDAASQLQGKAFEAHFRALGGNLTGRLTLSGRDRDFGLLIADLKALIAGPTGDSITYLTPAGDTLDVSNRPVDAGAIFIAAPPTVLRQLLPQLSFYNVRGIRLGSTDWNDEIVARLDANVTDGAVVPVIRQADSSLLRKRFISQYTAQFRESPGQLAQLGFDALLIALHALTHQTTDQMTLDRAALPILPGVAGRYDFTADGDNQAVQLATYSRKTLIPLLPVVSPAEAVLEQKEE